MSNAIDGPATTLLLSRGSATSGIAATVPNPPPPLSILSIGSQITGTVLGHNPQGQVLVQTDLGVISLATRAALPLGAQVTLQVRTSGAQLQVTITQIDGQPAYLKIGSDAGPAVPAEKRSVTEAKAEPPPASSRPTNPSTPAAPTPDEGLPTGQRTGPGRLLNSAPLVQISGQLLGPAVVPEALGRSNPIPGVILASRVSGELRVRTAAGTLIIASEGRLEPGSNVALRVRSTGPPPILAISQEPAARPHASAAPGSPSTAPPAATTTALPDTGLQQASQPRTASPSAVGGVELKLGHAVKAIVQAPNVIGPPSGQSVPAQAGNLPIGASVSVRILPGEPVRDASGGPRPGVPIQTSLAATQSPVASDVAQRAAGVLIGTTRQGQPLIQTSAGLLALDLRSPLPIGSRFIVEILTPAHTPLPIDARPEQIPLAHSWPALEELIKLLAELELKSAGLVSGGIGAQLSSLAQPGPKLSSALLFFLAALNGGDAGAWLNGLLKPQIREGLEAQGRRDLVGRLLQDFTQLGRLADLAGPDWRFLPIPLYDGGQIHQLRFFLRQQERRARDDSAAEPTEVTRFIVEVELSKIGDLQIDGLVKQRRFDLVLRTRIALPHSMRRDIREIFITANQAAGFAGNIGFEASEDWFPMPLSTAAGSQSLLI